jgi:hypothetical protein
VPVVESTPIGILSVPVGIGRVSFKRTEMLVAYSTKLSVLVGENTGSKYLVCAKVLVAKNRVKIVRKLKVIFFIR